MPVLVFNAENIEKWSKRFTEIDNEIASLHIFAKSLEATKAKDNLETCKDTIKGINSEIRRQELQRQTLLIGPYFAPEQYGRLYLYNAEKIQGLENSIRLLKKSRLTFQAEQTKIEQAVTSIDNEVIALVKKSNTLEEEKNSLKRNIAKGTEFLTTLQKDPFSLINELIIKIAQKLNDYDCEFPLHQSQLVRESSIEIRCALNCLNKKIQEKADLYSCYLTINGLLTKINNKYQQNKDNQERKFFEMISFLIAETHLEANGDLPDDLKIEPSSEHYAKVIKYDPNYAEIEKNSYTQAVRNFSHSLMDENTNNESRTQGYLLLKEIEIQKENSLQKQTYFDIKNATIILHQANKLLKKPDDLNERNQYVKIMNANTPSLLQQIGNVMKSFLETVLTGIKITYFFPDVVANTKKCIDNATHFCEQHGFFVSGIRTGVARKMNNFAVIKHPQSIKQDVEENPNPQLVIKTV